VKISYVAPTLACRRKGNMQERRLKVACEKHPGGGTIIISSGEQMCYGCWLEQFDYCPLCGRHWNNHPPDGIDCRTMEEVKDESPMS